MAASVPAGHPFPIQNLPFGAGTCAGSAPHCISIIGDNVINLAKLEEAGAFAGILPEAGTFASPYLNKFMGAGKPVW
jgi:fumarylacetoacetase